MPLTAAQTLGKPVNEDHHIAGLLEMSHQVKVLPREELMDEQEIHYRQTNGYGSGTARRRAMARRAAAR
jgi:hypothetical protein